MSNLGYLRHVVDAPAYRRGDTVPALRARIARLYGVPPEYVFLTSTGRAAATLFLRGVAADRDGDVALQAFTCVAAVLPVVWEGLRPVWIDADPHTLSLSVDGLAAALGERTRAVIVQHSFGLPGPVDDVLALTRPLGVPVLEDCAHALGVRAGGRLLGTAGDAAMLSFGVEKTLRTRYGGALVVNNAALLPALQAAHADLGVIGTSTIVRWLLHPLLGRALRLSPGPLKPRLRRTLVGAHLLAEELTESEVHGGPPPVPPSTLPGVFCALVLEELATLEANLRHRAVISDTYREALHGHARSWTPEETGPLLRYPLVCADPDQREAVAAVLDGHGVSRSRWFEPAVFPRQVDPHTVGYDPAMCPVAESLARRVINLPTAPHVRPSWARSLAADIRGVL